MANEKNVIIKKFEAYEMWNECKRMQADINETLLLEFDRNLNELYWIGDGFVKHSEGPYTIEELHTKLKELTDETNPTV